MKGETTMIIKKVYMVEELDCAHCAAKMEEGIRAIEGVEAASLSFLAQKLVMELEDSRIDEILREAQKVCHRVDPNCDILL